MNQQLSYMLLIVCPLPRFCDLVLGRRQSSNARAQWYHVNDCICHLALGDAFCLKGFVWKLLIKYLVRLDDNSLRLFLDQGFGEGKGKGKGTDR